MSEILIRPLVTEKMTGIQEKQGKYGFVVALNANKIEIKKAIEKREAKAMAELRTKEERHETASTKGNKTGNATAGKATKGKAPSVNPPPGPPPKRN